MSRANQFQLEVGDEVNLSFDIESREYNGRWFTSIRGWKAEKIDPNAAAQPGAPVAAAAGAPAAPGAPPPTADFSATGGESNDDLPF